MTNEFININVKRELIRLLITVCYHLTVAYQTRLKLHEFTLSKAANSKMFFNRRATIRCVLDSITPNIAVSAHLRDRALGQSAQPKSIGCEISRKAGINRREKNLSSDENPLGLIASEEDDSSSEIILQTETTGLGPIQIFSFFRTSPFRTVAITHR